MGYGTRRLEISDYWERKRLNAQERLALSEELYRAANEETKCGGALSDALGKIRGTKKCSLLCIPSVLRTSPSSHLPPISSGRRSALCGYHESESCSSFERRNSSQRSGVPCMPRRLMREQEKKDAERQEQERNRRANS